MGGLIPSMSRDIHQTTHKVRTVEDRSGVSDYTKKEADSAFSLACECPFRVQCPTNPLGTLVSKADRRKYAVEEVYTHTHVRTHTHTQPAGRKINVCGQFCPG